MGSTKSVLANIGSMLGKIPNSFTFQDPALINAPNTTILQINGSPRQLRDPSKTLNPILGTERIKVGFPILSTKEVGPNGEPVWRTSEDDDRVRLVGNWSMSSTTDGYFTLSTTVNDYVEITFFGTALNILGKLDGARDWRASVDGGAEGANFINFTGSGVIGNRNYSQNQVVPVVSGLALGTHTVKIRHASGNIVIYGFEIINSSSSIAIPQGEIFANGFKYINSTLQTSSYNSDFDGSPVLNGRGGRVVEYLSSSGIHGKVIQQTDAASAFLTTASHANEELLRRINFREFGSNRSDDFSTLADTVTDRAFTLDDGTTTLKGSAVRVFTSGGTLVNAPGVYTNSSGGAGGITLTFMGTGVDFITNFGNQSETTTIYVDGTSVGTVPYSANARNKLIKIASGLPYGIHTVRLERGGGGSDYMNISDFLIYGPKKPSIPSNSCEIKDYFLMGNYVAASTSADYLGPFSKSGCMFKSLLREMVYVGSWSIGGIDPNAPGGPLVLSSSGTGDYIQHTFFGTGFEIGGTYGAGTGFVFTLNIDGANYTGSAVATNSTVWNSGASTWTASSTSGWLRVTGLSLGVHTIRLTKTGGTSVAQLSGLNIITPVHYPNSKIGSMSMGPKVPFQKDTDLTGVDLSKAKAWVMFDGPNSTIVASYNVAGVQTDSAGVYVIYFQKPFKNTKYVEVVSANSFEAASIFSQRRPSSLMVQTANSAGSNLAQQFSLAVFGELEEE